MNHWTALLLQTCWIIWAVVWAAGWLYNLIRGPRTRSGSPDWSTILAVAAAWLVTHRMAGLPAALVIRGAVLAYAGAAVLVAGTAFTLWARIALGRMWSSAPSVKEGHELHTTGPYAVTRHPIYTGMLSMALGSVLLDGRLRILIVAALFLAYVLLKIRVEERLMAETFGERYTDYRRRTPQLIPWPRGHR